MDTGIFGLRWDIVWIADLKLSFSFAALSPVSGSHPVCHAPANREDGLGSETNVTKALWLKMLWWSWVEQGIAQQGVADGAGMGDHSMAWKAASLCTGLLTCAHFSVLPCLQRTLRCSEKYFKPSQDTRCHQKAYARLPAIRTFQTSLSAEVSVAAKLLWRELLCILLSWNAVKEILDFSVRKKYLNTGKNILLRKQNLNGLPHASWALICL